MQNVSVHVALPHLGMLAAGAVFRQGSTGPAVTDLPVPPAVFGDRGPVIEWCDRVVEGADRMEAALDGGLATTFMLQPRDRKFNDEISQQGSSWQKWYHLETLTSRMEKLQPIPALNVSFHSLRMLFPCGVRICIRLQKVSFPW